MDALTYALSQKICIYYKDTSWRDKVFYDIVNHYPIDWFEERGIFTSRHDCSLILKDGTTIRFVLATESARVGCFSKIIMQPGIDKKFIDCIIIPTLRHQNINAMVLKDNDEGLDFYK